MSRIDDPGGMTMLVLLHKADSNYDDERDIVYDFPRSYLRSVEEAVGDWIIYYEPVKAGPRGYFAAAQIAKVIPKPGVAGRFLALIEAGSFLPFDRPVPRLLYGRPEVQVAHIRAVANDGNDSTRNGLALSGTLHWMFDRGLLSVAEDCETILVSRNKVPGDVVDRLLSPSGKLIRPADPRDYPHPANLTWHRENVFGQVIADGPAPWEGPGV